MQLRIQVLRSTRGYSLCSGITVHLLCLVSLLSSTQYNCQPHFQIPYSSQRTSGKVEPRAYSLSTVILPEEPIRLKSLSALGRVCPKLSLQASYRHHLLPMHPRLPTSNVSMVRRALRLTGSQLLFTTQ